MFNFPRFRPLMASVVGAVALMTAVSVQAVTSDEIIKRGNVKIGVLSGVPIYGFTDDKGQPAGYDIDVARLLGTYLGVKVELVPVPPPARIALLQGGKADLLVATLGPTPERAKQVMFTEPYSAFRIVAVGNKANNVTKLEDLGGKRVGVNRGSSQETFISRANIPGLQLGRFQDDATAFDALVGGQLDIVAVPESVAKDQIQRKPDAGVAIKFALFNQGNAMAVKLEDTELRDWLNKAIDRMRTSGELDKISVKWTGSPVPR